MTGSIIERFQTTDDSLYATRKLVDYLYAAGYDETIPLHADGTPTISLIQLYVSVFSLAEKYHRRARVLALQRFAVHKPMHVAQPNKLIDPVLVMTAFVQRGRENCGLSLEI